MPIVASIPERYEEGFKQLSTLSDSQFSALNNALNANTHCTSIEDLSEKIETSDGLIDVDVEEILVSVGRLQTSLDSKEIIDEVVNDVTDLTESAGVIEENSKELFKSRLKVLLDNDKIFYAAKADDLINNYSNAFIQSRIISDIRPVFNLSVDEAPTAGVILHNLTIHYQPTEEPYHKDITMTLTYKDIRNLQAILRRAEKKELALRTILEKAEMKNLNE